MSFKLFVCLFVCFLIKCKQSLLAMETVPVRRATSVPLRHNLREDATSVERDINSTPIVPRNISTTNQSSSSIPISDPVARTLSQGTSSPYQIGNYKLAPKRPSETTLPNLSRDTKTQIRTPLLANKIGLPTFRRPHSNPNLPNEKRTYTSSGDVIGTKKLESEPELSRDSKSALGEWSVNLLSSNNTRLY